MIAKSRIRIIALSVGAVLALGGAAGCGGNGGDGEPTLQDMKAWQKKIESNERITAVKDLDEDDLLVDCEGTAKDLDDAVRSAPAPPYKGEEYKTNLSRAVDLIEDYCELLKDFDVGRAAVLEARFDALMEKQDAWEDDANTKFPGLNLKK